MGAGKTTVGRKLCRLLSYDFIDTDQLLEERTGVSVSHIFEVEGEQGFRDRESRLLAEVSESTNTVISTGGGMILREQNRQVMTQHGQVVYLRATLKVLWMRLKDCQNRPLLQTPNPKAKVNELIIQRGPMYTEVADIIIDVTSDSAHKTALKISKILKQDNNEGS